ncbi:TPA: hypothetical protein ACY3HD_003748 [Enterobacter asburiae]
MSNIDKQALRVPERKKHNWAQAVMRDCDFCQQWALTVNHNDGGSICASCCDSEYTSSLSSALVVAIERAEAAEKLNEELMEKQRLIDICQGQGLEHRIAAEKRAEAAEKKTVEMPTFDGYVPHVARELQAAFRIACDNAGINIAAAGKGE